MRGCVRAAAPDARQRRRRRRRGRRRGLQRGRRRRGGGGRGRRLPVAGGHRALPRGAQRRRLVPRLQPALRPSPHTAAVGWRRRSGRRVHSLLCRRGQLRERRALPPLPRLAAALRALCTGGAGSAARVPRLRASYSSCYSSCYSSHGSCYGSSYGSSYGSARAYGSIWLAGGGALSGEAAAGGRRCSRERVGSGGAPQAAAALSARAPAESLRDHPRAR